MEAEGNLIKKADKIRNESLLEASDRLSIFDAEPEIGIETKSEVVAASQSEEKKDFDMHFVDPEFPNLENKPLQTADSNTAAVVGIEPLESTNVTPNEVKKVEKKEKTKKAGEPEKSSEKQESLSPLEIARKQYAKTEFRDRKAMEEIKRFSKLVFSKEDIGETPNIKTAREMYEAALSADMQSKVMNLKDKGLKGEKLNEELEKLMIHYKVTAAHELYNARTEEKIAYMREKGDKSAAKHGLDVVMSGMTSIANFYNKKVPLWLKGGLAVGSFVAGAGVFTSGKRIWGALMMATSGGMALDALAQKVDSRAGQKDTLRNISEATDKKGKVDFEKIKNFLEDDIKKIDKKLNKFVFRSYAHKTIAVGTALLLGTLATTGLFKALDDYKVGGNAAPGGIPKPDSGAALNAKVQTPLSDAAFGKPDSGTPINMRAPGATGSFEQPLASPETVAEKAHSSKVEIRKPFIGADGHKKYDSIWRGLKDHLKQAHPEWDEKHLNGATQTIFRDGVLNYANENKISYDAAVARLSKIHPGTSFDVTPDANGSYHMNIDEDNVNFMKAAKAAVPAAEISAPMLTPPLELEINADELAQQWKGDVVATQAGELLAQEEKHEIASSIASRVRPVLDGDSPNFQENARYATELSRAASSNVYNWAPAYEAGRIGSAVKIAREHMESLLAMDDKETFNNIRKTFFDSSIINLHKFENVNVREALSNQESLSGLSKKAIKTINGYASIELTKPLPDEDFKHWTYRIMNLTRESVDNKLAA